MQQCYLFDDLDAKKEEMQISNDDKHQAIILFCSDCRLCKAKTLCDEICGISIPEYFKFSNVDLNKFYNFIKEK